MLTRVQSAQLTPRIIRLLRVFSALLPTTLSGTRTAGATNAPITPPGPPPLRGAVVRL